MIAAVLGLAAIGFLAAAPPQAPATAPPPSATKMVLKGKAPVSNDVLKVKLPRPQEADLANGLHLMVLEDRRLPQITFTLLIRGAGGYFDPGASRATSKIQHRCSAITSTTGSTACRRTIGIPIRNE